MIIPIEMYGCKCDNCGKQWVDEDMGFTAFTDKPSISAFILDDHAWHADNEKHYCPKCFSFDDDDNLIINPPSVG